MSVDIAPLQAGNEWMSIDIASLQADIEPMSLDTAPLQADRDPMSIDIAPLPADRESMSVDIATRQAGIEPKDDDFDRPQTALFRCQVTTVCRKPAISRIGRAGEAGALPPVAEELKGGPGIRMGEIGGVDQIDLGFLQRFIL